MTKKLLRIGTRESQLAVWQANRVKDLLAEHGFESELVFIKSDGDIDLQTPLYEIGVQGIFTHTLDIALLNKRIDIAVHSLKDVPTQLAKGIVQCAVLKRASYKDLLVLNVTSDLAVESNFSTTTHRSPRTIATSSIRRKAQWLNKYPNDVLENLRGNVNTRLKKVKNSNWHGAIFAAAGLERIGLRPAHSIELNWMLPAPAQGAIGVVCLDDDKESFEACQHFNDAETELCTSIEKSFLRTLLGGCSTPISALAEIRDGIVFFKGNIFSVDGTQRVDIEKNLPVSESESLGILSAKELLGNGGKAIADTIQNAR